MAISIFMNEKGKIKKRKVTLTLSEEVLSEVWRVGSGLGLSVSNMIEMSLREKLMCGVVSLPAEGMKRNDVRV